MKHNPEIVEVDHENKELIVVCVPIKSPGKVDRYDAFEMFTDVIGYNSEW